MKTILLTIVLFALTGTVAHALTRADIDLLFALGIIPADKLEVAYQIATPVASQVPAEYRISGCQNFSRDLRKGMRGTDVANLQTLLIQEGYLRIPDHIPLGYFGVLTEQAVIDAKRSLHNYMGSDTSRIEGAVTGYYREAITAYCTGNDYVEPLMKNYFESSVGNLMQAEARNRGSDAAIKANVANMRVHAELFYDSRGNSYSGFCASPEAQPALEALNSVSTVSCRDSATAWSAAAKLVSDGSGYFCADSVGRALEYQSSSVLQGTSCE